ncbi:Flp pilus assembly protein CpaB [Syntrophaceticus schinkii]|uniref:Putative Flp pilus assembly protein CpaB n=1 Tax=Syntrophaceticus schinkii TaxID=499207 RepID=A0A0B7MJN2_9FIRM|nr:Flp pilus assembly protein CpaB [Syntrophaceticus schinkii]CEO88378.1 putative Flp pilus assembly protein CpaB [Syntrophaceticus schinkii]
MRPKLMIILAVILALLATGMCYFYLQNAVEKADQTEKAQVVQARVEIPKDTNITKEMVELVKVPVDSIHSRALRSLDDVVGKIALDAIIPGEQVLQDRLVKEGDTKAGLPYQIPAGKRAITVAVDEVAAVGWHLQPGDHVDILGIVTAGEQGKSSVVVLQDVLVLAVGKNTQVTREQETEATIEVKTVTLAVTLQEARPLMFANEEGKMRFALRSPVDHERQTIVPFSMGEFLTPSS